MASKKLIIILTALLAVAFSVSAQPAISWQPSEIDFGVVPVRAHAFAGVWIDNMNGTESLQVSAHTEGACFNVPTDQIITLMPGDSAFDAFEVDFHPQEEIAYTGTLFLTTNDPQHPSVEIPLTGSGGAAATGSILVTVLDLDSNPIEGAEVVLFTFHGGHEVGRFFSNAAGQVLIEEIDVGPYRVEANAEDFRPQSRDIVVTPNQQLIVTFQLHPSLDEPTIHVMPQVLEFGPVPIGHTAVGQFYVGNLGNETLEVNASIAGDAFNIQGPHHFWVSPEDSGHVVMVAFMPSSENEYNGTVTFTSNDPNHPTINVPLTGTGLEIGMGRIEGFVVTDDPVSGETPVEDAHVRIDYIRGGNGLYGPHLATFTNELGAFEFDDVVWGFYSITASKPQVGFASEVISVETDQTTHVTLSLICPSGADSDSVVVDPRFEIVELSGTAIVVEANDYHSEWYFLDVDDDGVADYMLNFGPPWYEPASGATRPEHGDFIEITGGLMSYGETPIIVVYMINGLAWQNSPIGGGHGGNMGDRLLAFGCDPADISWIELSGVAQDFFAMGLHFHAIDTDENGSADYILDYGDSYEDLGEHVPHAGESVDIVGGLVNCDLSEYGLLPWVIVYEIDTVIWRAPGDTTGMGPFITVEVSERIEAAIPEVFEVAQNYPNPFNPATTIEFSIPSAGQVGLVIYDITGREVESLLSGNLTAGKYSVEWNGVSAPSGIYFYRVTYGDQQLTRRMLLLK